MALSLTLSSLSSRAIRIASTDVSGIRRIATNAITTSQQNNESPLVSIYDGLNRFGNSLMQFTIRALTGSLNFSISAIWSWIVSAALQVTNFNWNITDTQLDDEVKQAEIAVAGARGALRGATIGYAICGFIPVATIAVFNEAMALYALKELGEEAAEEIGSLAATYIQLVLQQNAKKNFANLYKSYRHILRPAAIGVANLLVRLGVLTQDSVDKADKNRKQPWSFHSALEDSIESIPNLAQREETEQFWEELGEACIEAGYIVAGGIDSYLAQQHIANAGILGSERIVEIQPIRSANTSGSTPATP